MKNKGVRPHKAKERIFFAHPVYTYDILVTNFIDGDTYASWDHSCREDVDSFCSILSINLSFF